MKTRKEIKVRLKKGSLKKESNGKRKSGLELGRVERKEAREGELRRDKKGESGE